MLHTLIGADRERVRDHRARADEGLPAQRSGPHQAIRLGISGLQEADRRSDGPMDVDLQSLDPEELDAIIEFAFLRYFDDSGLFGTVEDAVARVEQVKAIGVDEIACLIDFGVRGRGSADGAGATRDGRCCRQSRTERRRPRITTSASAALFARHGVTHLQCTPSMAAMILMDDEDRSVTRRRPPSVHRRRGACRQRWLRELRQRHRCDDREHVRPDRDDDLVLDDDRRARRRKASFRSARRSRIRSSTFWIWRCGPCRRDSRASCSSVATA